jgi:flagellar basal-body rod protein FlgF
MFNNTIYGSALGTILAMKRLDVVANNLANASTPGFKADRVRETANPTYVSREEFDRFRRRLRSVNDLLSADTQLSQGPVEMTRNDFDLAIKGEGFFELQTPTGPVYTRAGGFRVGREGMLVGGDNFPVMGEGGPIAVKDGDLAIRADGEVMVNGAVVDRLKLVAFDDSRVLSKQAGTTFVARGGQTPRPAEGATIVQGALEGSNVNPVRTMVELLDISRVFEMEMKAIQMADQINQKATATLGKVR